VTRFGVGAVVERGSLFGRGQAGGGAACPLFFALVLQDPAAARCVLFGRGLAKGGAASVGIVPVRASHRCGRVRERFRTVWRRPSHSGWCAPPTIVGGSENGYAWSGGGQQPPFIWCYCLSARASHCRGRVRERLRMVWRRPARPHYLRRPGVDDCWCVLILLRASLGTALRWVAAAGKRPTLFGPSVDEFVGVPPSIHCGSTRALAKRSGRKPSSHPSGPVTSLLSEGVIEEPVAAVS